MDWIQRYIKPYLLQPSGYMVRAFHWQYGDILLAIYIYIYFLYSVLSLKNKYTILYYSGCVISVISFGIVFQMRMARG